jgi:hypothetical protein
VTGPFKIAIHAMGGLLGRATGRDVNVLLSLRVVEGQVREKYQRYAARHWPEELAPIIQEAAAGEASHYAWIRDQLRAAGYGDESLAGSMNAAAEALHTLVATPIESATRQMTEFFTRSR